MRKNISKYYMSCGCSDTASCLTVEVLTLANGNTFKTVYTLCTFYVQQQFYNNNNNNNNAVDDMPRPTGTYKNSTVVVIITINIIITSLFCIVNSPA